MFEIPNTGPGHLWIMPRPQDLPQDIARWQSAGMTHVVSMLGQDEADTLGLGHEPELAQAAGLTFRAHPIRDFHLPQCGGFSDLVADICRGLRAGGGYGVHCRGGIGRSGMVCAGVLIAQGQTAKQAIAAVSLARGISVPDTAEQATFIADFARQV